MQIEQNVGNVETVILRDKPDKLNECGFKRSLEAKDTTLRYVSLASLVFQGAPAKTQ